MTRIRLVALGVMTAATAPAAGQEAVTPAASSPLPVREEALLWDPSVPIPKRSEMTAVEPLTRVTFHRAIQGEYQFLSGPCIAGHKGRLFACWTNSRLDESPDIECVRGRWSEDGGKTWGEVEVVAGDATPKATYGHGTILSHQGRLWVFPARFLPGQGKDPMRINMEAFVLREPAGKWEPLGVVASNFWAQEAPKPLPGGGWIVGGDADPYPGCGPAVALVDKDDPAKWQVVRIPIPYGKTDYYAGETTLWTDRGEVVAIIRNAEKDVALMSISKDAGKTWSVPVESNWPMAESRAYAGVLSTGQRYLVCNSGNREFLVIAVSRPGEALLSKVRMLRQGRVQPRWPTHSKKPQWSYPWVTEHEGSLFVAYAAGKEDGELSIVPLEALSADP